MPAVEAALATFLTLTPADRIADSRHVYAYYRDIHYTVGGEDWLDEEMGVPQTSADIWASVTPGPVMVTEWYERWYVVMEAECPWEEEHGLMIVWQDGAKLSKVGPYNGLVTNGRGYDGREDAVYSAIGDEYTTRL
ncbi:hypothetical protein A5792_15880 [Mycolicibacterium peregrinum]|uniref:DUF6985 domain-containing protein n=1 Tax=Mycolicibacterium peregrinum TaxID=43304 RepID=A0A1A0RAY6_MYCPR|nr:hypothetical protein [Mycolicibacterium peregrinum]OBB31665.1 hypothetical protein A5792_15880 [Mycolicibacterium peregrinum]